MTMEQSGAIQEQFDRYKLNRINHLIAPSTRAIGTKNI